MEMFVGFVDAETMEKAREKVKQENRKELIKPGKYSITVRKAN